MEPLFNDGTPLIVKHVQPEEIKIGDIAVFRTPDKTIAHRIIEKIQEGDRLCFLEKKDSGFEPGMISEDAIIGKVIGFQRGERNVNLEKGIWKLANSLVGYYWSITYALYKGVKTIKIKIFREKKYALASKIYFVSSSFLIHAARFFISLVHRLNLPKNKP